MTRKEFQLIADAIGKWHPPLVPEWALSQLRTQLAKHMADCLATTNPRFDRDRFINAATEGR